MCVSVRACVCECSVCLNEREKERMCERSRVSVNSCIVDSATRKTISIRRPIDGFCPARDVYYSDSPIDLARIKTEGVKRIAPHSFLVDIRKFGRMDVDQAVSFGSFGSTRIPQCCSFINAYFY